MVNLVRAASAGIAGLMVLTICSCNASNRARLSEDQNTPVAGKSMSREKTLMDSSWAFHLGDLPNKDDIIATNYDDAAWERVDVPHDYVLGGKYFESKDRAVRGRGYLPYDVGWYRKRFTVPTSDAGKILRLDFDGVFRDSQVWLNGQLLGQHASGYTPFSFDITKLAKFGGENVLVVRVDPREREGWWYEGGGIYRHVWLTALSPVHVAQWGTYVRATVPNGDRGASDEARLSIESNIENQSPATANCELVSEIVDANGKSVKTVKSTLTAGMGGQQILVQHVEIDHPKIWSLESPQLYELHTTLLRDGKVVDRTRTNFGIRTLRFDPDKGFFLNGKHVEIQGVANHQDFGGVGIAVPDSLQQWRVEQLKQAGCNGWRTAHNPPAEATLDACDRLGMLVMDENRHLGNTYTNHSASGTSSNNLEDLATMIRRDRNHPSIIMWSMCNEEGLQGKPEGVAIFKNMMKVVHQYDRSRPITSAMNNGWLNPVSDADVEDIIGVNYNTKNYDKIHQRHPDKMIFGSEDTNEKTTRGEYEDNPATGMRSCYNLSEKDWLAVVDRPWMAGSYTWTGFDYRGEPNPYGWPDVSNNTGLLDLCGFPKDKRYYFQSCWSKEPMVHIMPGTWNWPGKQGQDIRVLAFSNAKRVELFLNGKSLGVQEMPHDAHVEWQVRYAPGELTAKAYDGSKVVATDKVETTGSAKRIKLTTARTKLRSNAEDAVVVTVSLLDDKGRVVPNDDHRITFQVSGNGKLLGVSNGNPSDHDSDKANNRRTFHGLCIAVVEAGAAPGDLKITATSPDIKEDTQTLSVH